MISSEPSSICKKNMQLDTITKDHHKSKSTDVIFFTQKKCKDLLKEKSTNQHEWN